ncbi:MAG: DNA mismatch repair protein MutS [Gammaproteobacteria bacterium]|nr:DNA mismatch repair protein MutS [Gammaproteobacteria bacterium]
MSKRNKISIEDSRLFRENIGQVKPVKQDHIAPFRKPPSPRPRPVEHFISDIIQDRFSDEYEPADAHPNELWFSRTGIQHNTLRRLKSGRFNNTATLDLHGLTVPDARQTLLEFLNHCYRLELRFIRIIHGKGHHSHNGQAKLKHKVDNWLRQCHEVLAFCSTDRAHGGTGAVNVLLRTR